MNSSLKIAVLYTPLIQAGGAERQMLEEVAQLRQRGHNITILTFRLDPSALFGRKDEVDGVVVLRATSAARKLLELRKALRNGRFDLLLSHTTHELTGLATRGLTVPVVQYHNRLPSMSILNPLLGSRRYRRLPPSSTPADSSYEVTQPVRGLRRARAELRTHLVYLGLRRAAAVLVLSQKSADELEVVYGITTATVLRGCLPARLVTHGPPVVSRPLEYPSGACTILSVSRLVADKRLDLLLKAFARIRATGNGDTRLFIVGTGPEAELLRKLARDLAVDDATVFTGFVPEDELPRYLAHADVFAAPAMADYNIAPYEGLAYRCRVVWTVEMETDPQLVSSGWVHLAEPNEESFAQAMLSAITARPAPPPPLSSMTWEERGRRLEEICLRVTRARR